MVGTVLGDENYFFSFNSSSIYNSKSLDLSNGWKPQTSVTFQETMVARNMRKLKANSFKQQIKPHMSQHM